MLTIGMKFAPLWGMKHFILISALSFHLMACGSDKILDPSSDKKVEATPTPAPTEEPHAKTDLGLVGNWVDIGGNVLAFHKDGTAMSKSQKLSWSIDLTSHLLFMADTIEVDSCSYEILSSGGLNKDLMITLDLGCQKSGGLTFTRAP